MEENFIFIGIVVAIVMNFAIYFFIKDRKDEKELKDYFKSGKKRKVINTK